jgi:O-antigen/teichoic acid export membrane protein
MITPMIGFIMLPIYTRYLSPAEYGVMTTVQTLVGILHLFLLLCLHGAITRFFYDFLDKPEKQREYLGSIFFFVLIFSSVVSIMLLFFSDLIGTVLFKNISIDPYYYYLIGISWVYALIALPMALFRAQEKAGLFVLTNLINAVLIMGVTIYLLVGKGLGAESALIAQLICTSTVVVIIYSFQFKYLKFSINGRYVKQSLLFSLPLLPHVASGWIIGSSSRVILEKFVNMTDLGIYSLASQVSMVLALFYTSINNALVPRYTSLRKIGDEAKANKLIKIFTFVILIAGICYIPVAMYAIKLVATSNYHGAMSIIPALIIGQIITGFYYIPVAKLFYSTNTTAIAKSSTVAAIANISINIITIPMIGIYGAVLATVSSELLRLLLIYRASKKE